MSATSASNQRPGSYAKQRRSRRILLSIPVIVSGQQPQAATFSERTRTLVISAHAALLELRQAVVVWQALRIKHLATGEELACRVVDVNPGSTIPEIGVEFDQPCAHFWRVSFPPTDWNSRSPEAKGFDFVSPAGTKK